MIRAIILVAVSVSSLFLSINWSAPSLHIFNQTVFAFQSSNQQQGEGRQQQEEILLSSSSSNDSFHSVTNTSGHPSSPSFPLQDSQRGTITTATMTVEIVLGAALVGNKSYDPSPLIAGPNTTIVWHNADEILHTVTSGLEVEDNNMEGKEFDSSIIIPDNTYFHTFSEIGEYPYFCTLHPTMVGKIIIIRNET